MKTKLLTSVLSVLFFTTLSVHSANYTFKGATSINDLDSYKWSDTSTANQPWANGSPNRYFEEILGRDNVIWTGGSYVLVDKTDAFGSIQVANGAKNGTLNLQFTGTENTLNMAFINSIDRPATINFDVKDDSSRGKVVLTGYDMSTTVVADRQKTETTMYTTGANGVGAFGINVGKGVTMDINLASYVSVKEYTFSNEVAAGSNVRYGTLTISGTLNSLSGSNKTEDYVSLQFIGNGINDANSTHRDLIVASGGAVNADQLYTQNQTKITVDGEINVKQLIAAGGTSDVLTIDFGSSGIIKVEDIGGVDSCVNILNFRENSFQIKNDDAGTNKYIVENAFFAYNGQGWVNSFTLSDDGWLVLATVPEPSTYATIFGAIALAIALKRRSRK